MNLEFPVGTRWTDTDPRTHDGPYLVLANVTFDGSDFVVCGDETQGYLRGILLEWARAHFAPLDGAA